MKVGKMARDSILTNSEIRPKAFVHIALRTNQLQKMIDFYKSFLNAWEVLTADYYSFLTYDEEHHRIVIVGDETIPTRTPKSAGLEHFSYAFDTLGDLLANYLRLKDKDIMPFWCINHGPTTSIYYFDPDGNKVETQVDNFDDHDELVGFFETDAFKANPLGVQFDPDKLVELYLEGRPEEELVRQGTAPRAPGTEYVFEL